MSATSRTVGSSLCPLLRSGEWLMPKSRISQGFPDKQDQWDVISIGVRKGRLVRGMAHGSRDHGGREACPLLCAR